MGTMKLVIGVIIVVGLLFSLIDFENYFESPRNMADLYGYCIGYIYTFFYGIWLILSVSRKKKFYRKLYFIKVVSIVTSLVISCSGFVGIALAIENTQITASNIYLSIFSTTLVLIFFIIAVVDIKSMISEIKDKGSAKL